MGVKAQPRFHQVIDQAANITDYIMDCKPTHPECAHK